MMAAQFFRHNREIDKYIRSSNGIIVQNTKTLKCLCVEYEKYENKETYNMMKELVKFIMIENKRQLDIYKHYINNMNF